MDTRLTIMIITYNRKRELYRAIKSALPHIKDSMEIVIVDNNSHDGTEEFVRSLLETSNVRYTYHYSNSNKGVAGGRNCAFKLSKGKYVFSLDDDAVIITDNIFEKACDLMDTHFNAAACGINIYEPETNTYRNCVHRFSRVKSHYDFALSYSGGAHILRKSIFSSEALYPEKLSYGSEELYASLKAWNKGKTVIFAKELTVYHLPSTWNLYSGEEQKHSVIVNNYIIKKLMYPKLMLAPSYCVFMLRLLKNGLFTSEWRAKTIKLINERYDINEQNPLSISIVIKLTYFFGLNTML